MTIKDVYQASRSGAAVRRARLSAGEVPTSVAGSFGRMMRMAFARPPWGG
jgi:hypothetical protein